MSTEKHEPAPDQPEDPTGAPFAHGAVHQQPLDEDAARLAVSAPEYGAVVSFSGVVRNHDDGRSVTLLRYSAHPSADSVLREIAAEIVEEFGGGRALVRVWVEHRYGDLRIGDSALVAAVASAHRKLAFEVCAELVERVKERIPVWKEQEFTDGTSEWVNSA